MRYIVLAAAPIALSFACQSTPQANPVSPTQTTSAQIAARDAGWTEEPRPDVPSQGWDNPSSNQVADPPESILKNTGSR
jgi:hypothetical protein